MGEARRRTILVVEDSPTVRTVIVSTLEGHGYECIVAADGMEALAALSKKPDLVVLDLMLPTITGLEVLASVRQADSTPVIILSSLDADANRVRGLQLGADDYVTKPFHPPELAARVDALLRRTERRFGDGREILHGGIRIDLEAREVWIRGSLVDTTAKEFDLLVHLATSPGVVFTRRRLLQSVWSSSPEWQMTSTVTEHIRRLRLKIELDAKHPKYLTTVRGVGYRFDRREGRAPIADLAPAAGPA